MSAKRRTGTGDFLPFYYNRENDRSDRVLEFDQGGHIATKGWKNHLVAVVGEFVGTFMFLFFAFAGTSVAKNASNLTGEIAAPETDSNIQQLLFIALSFGFSLAVNVWIFFRISGGLFNPAVTLGLLLTNNLSLLRASLIFISQLLASMASAAVVRAMFPTGLNVATTLESGTTLAQGLFIEAFLTFELVFTIFMLASEKHKATFLAPIGIGLALFIAELAGVYYTGGSLNPARSFGPAVATASFPSEHWIYWVGPGLGSLAATGFYTLVKKLDYEQANPGQDRDPKENFVTVRTQDDGEANSTTTRTISDTDRRV